MNRFIIGIGIIFFVSLTSLLTLANIYQYEIMKKVRSRSFANEIQLSKCKNRLAEYEELVYFK